MCTRSEFIGAPTELSQQIDPDGQEGITPKKVSRKILQSVEALSHLGISALIHHSNGKWVIVLYRAESADSQDAPEIDPIDPKKATGAALPGIFEPGEQ